jgi:hypothetical protein
VKQQHFDEMTRILAGASNRRHVLRGLFGASLGVSLAQIPGLAAARKRRKRKKNKSKRPKPNAFGCLEIGDACKDADQCCSGICEVHKGKRSCRPHDTGICKQGKPGFCTADNPSTIVCNEAETCGCVETTAGSNVCALLDIYIDDLCADCKTDADCEALGFAEGTACAPFVGGFCDFICPNGTACLTPCPAEP